MSIEWNKVTWYSKFIAVILFVGIFWLGYVLGNQAGMFAQESLEPNPVVLSDTNEVTLGVGETGQISTLLLTLNSFEQDYRCPLDVSCIEAGAVVVHLTMTEGSNSVTRNFPSDETPYEFGNYEISIVNVTPDARSGEVIPEYEYQITFRVDAKN